jgi:glycerophosphoryl diester phosphodiesterase
MTVIGQKGISDHTIIQSFDQRTLQVMRKKYPQVKLALLVENLRGPKINIQQLGFLPTIYSPNYALLTPSMIKYVRSKGIKIIPWTVNERADIRHLLKMQVDGIISDYPDRVLRELNQTRK